MFQTLIRTLLSVYLIIMSVKSEEFKTQQKILNKTVALNDLVELKCNLPNEMKPYSNDSSVNGTKNSPFLPENEFNLWIFKKNNSLIQLKKAILVFRIDDISDSGIYECGYFEIDNYGKMSYVLQSTWDIHVSGTL